jgi:SAM-dependent methyltransferase
MTDNYKKEKYVYDFSDEWNRNHNKTKIIEQYKKYLGENIAELGSNSGYHCFIMGEFNKTKNIIGFDINYEAIKFGDTVIRKKFSKNIEKKVSFKQSNLNNIISDDEIFDTIISFHTLEHIYPNELNKVVLEKYRILKKNGYLIISLPYKKAFPDPKHVNFFDVPSLKNLFTSNRFDCIECYIDNRMSDNPNQLCITGLFRKT